ETCHGQGLFHGLLKPSNIMISADGQVRILDLGIGCLLAESEGESLVDTMSTANSVASGLDCASPESIMDPSNLTAMGDQYSLGCMLYHALSGRFPFPEGTAVEKMMAHQTKQPPPIHQLCPELPADLVAAIERLMQKEPTARFASTAEALASLRPFAGAMPTIGRQSLRPVPLPPTRGSGSAAASTGDPARAGGRNGGPGGRAMPSVPRPPSHPDRKAAIPTRGSLNEGHGTPVAKTSLAAAPQTPSAPS